MAFRVRYGDAEHLVVDIGPGTSEQGIEKAVAGCVGLPVGTFVLKNAAGVTSTFHAGLVGDWDVVLLPGRAAPGAGGVAGALAGESNLAIPENLSVKSFISRYSDVAADASTTFLRFVHDAFPSSSLDQCREKLLGDDVPPPLLSSRLFEEKDFMAAFAEARAAFVRDTLDAEKPARIPNIQVLEFNPNAKYANPSFDKLEFDCIVKLPAPHSCVWTRDASAGAVSDKDLFFIGPRSSVMLRERESPPQPAVASSRCETSSNFSVEFYPQGATLYVVGEVYMPFAGSEAAQLAQKLLQAERQLQFLMAKERVKNVRDCVLGYIFMGPSMNYDVGTSLFNTLRHYKRVLPCLWALAGTDSRQHTAERRLLGCHVERFHAAAAVASLERRLERRLTAQYSALSEQIRQIRLQGARRRCAIV